MGFVADEARKAPARRFFFFHVTLTNT
jgi:hypothetical protein